MVNTLIGDVFKISMVPQYRTDQTVENQKKMTPGDRRVECRFIIPPVRKAWYSWNKRCTRRPVSSTVMAAVRHTDTQRKDLLSASGSDVF